MRSASSSPRRRTRRRAAIRRARSPSTRATAVAPACSGNGFEHVEMQFLSDVYLRCPDCNGKRYRDEVLEIKVDGRNIADVLELTISEALTAFAHDDNIVRCLQPLVGRGARLSSTRPAGPDAFGRRSPAPEARGGTWRKPKAGPSRCSRAAPRIMRRVPVRVYSSSTNRPPDFTSKTSRSCFAPSASCSRLDTRWS